MKREPPESNPSKRLSWIRTCSQWRLQRLRLGGGPHRAAFGWGENLLCFQYLTFISLLGGPKSIARRDWGAMAGFALPWIRHFLQQRNSATGARRCTVYLLLCEIWVANKALLIFVIFLFHVPVLLYPLIGPFLWWVLPSSWTPECDATVDIICVSS